MDEKTKPADNSLPGMEETVSKSDYEKVLSELNNAKTALSEYGTKEKTQNTLMENERNEVNRKLKAAEQYQKLAESYEKDLKEANLKLSKISEDHISVSEKANKYDYAAKAIEGSVKQRIGQLNDDQKKKLKSMSSWVDSDPIAQMNALNDFDLLSSQSTTPSKQPFQAGSAGGAKPPAYMELLKQGNYKEAVKAKLALTN